MNRAGRRGYRGEVGTVDFKREAVSVEEHSSEGFDLALRSVSAFCVQHTGRQQEGLTDFEAHDFLIKQIFQRLPRDRLLLQIEREE